MTWTSRPFAGTSRNIANESQQRDYFGHLGDGIINARSMTDGKLVADGTSVVRLQPCFYKLRGLYAEGDAEEAFNLATLAPTPPAGQSRIDRLAMRLDTAAKTIAPVVVAGDAALNPVVPALKWGEDGLFEREMWTWQYTGAGLSQNGLGDRRTWLGPHLMLADAAELPAFADIGTTATRRGFSWAFRSIAGAAPSWTVAAEQVVEKYEAARATTSAAFPVLTGEGFLNGALNIPSRTYRRLLRAEASALVVGRSATTVELDAGFKLFRGAVPIEERAKLARVGLGQTSLSRSWVLEADSAYSLQWIGSTNTGNVSVTADPRFTYLSAETRGML